MTRIHVTNNTSGPLWVPSDLKGKKPGQTTIEQKDGARLIGGIAPAPGLVSHAWIPLRTCYTKGYDLQIYLCQSSKGVSDYAVQVYDGGKSRKSETLPGTRVWLDGKNLHVAIDYAFEPWMKLLTDDKRLDQLTIPGTHDSGTWDSSNYDQCQHLTIEEQLYLGVRYFDIRVDTGSQLDIVHAGNKTSYTLGQVASIFRDFLTGKSGPDGTQEIVVMQLKVDSGDDDATTGERILHKLELHCGAKALYRTPLGLSGTIETLGDLRGKLVLLRRFEHEEDDNSGTPVKYFVPQSVYARWEQATPATFDASPEKFEWCDPGTGEIEYRNRHGLSFRIQDNYETTKEIKWNIVCGVLDDTVHHRLLPHSWYLNFTSTAPGDDPETMAGYVNPRVEEWLDAAVNRENSLPRYGTILMDFPTLNMIRRLMQKNFIR